ncbi:hypothetical protein A6R68_22145, partial [Neotoma lepida]
KEGWLCRSDCVKNPKWLGTEVHHHREQSPAKECQPLTNEIPAASVHFGDSQFRSPILLPWAQLRWSSSLDAPQPVAEEKSQSSESFTENSPQACPAQQRGPSLSELRTLREPWAANIPRGTRCSHPNPAFTGMDPLCTALVPSGLRKPLIGKERRDGSWKPDTTGTLCSHSYSF